MRVSVTGYRDFRSCCEAWQATIVDGSQLEVRMRCSSALELKGPC